MTTKATYTETNAKLNSTQVEQYQFAKKKYRRQKYSLTISFNNQKIITCMEEANN